MADGSSARQANVGVSGEAGALTLGRQMNMSMYVFQNGDVIGPSIHSIPNFDSYRANARSDNAVGYRGRFGGFTVGGTSLRAGSTLHYWRTIRGTLVSQLRVSAPLSSSAYTDTPTIVDGYVKYGDVKVGGGWLRRNTSAAIHTQSDLFFVGASYLISPAF